MRFTVEELMMIRIYANIYKDGLSGCLNAMKESIPYIDDEYIKKETEEVIRKLSLITDEEYSQIDFRDIMIEIDDIETEYGE